MKIYIQTVSDILGTKGDYWLPVFPLPNKGTLRFYNYRTGKMRAENTTRVGEQRILNFMTDINGFRFKRLIAHRA